MSSRRLALVTGASGGIGRATAIALAAEGFGLILTGRSMASLEATRSAVRDAARPVGGDGNEDKHGDEAEHGNEAAAIPLVPCDLEHAGSIAALADSVRAAGRLDVLVNSAGMAPSGAFEDYSAEDWDRTMAVNARGPFLLTQALLPLLRGAAPGYLINIGSVVSKQGYPNQAIYSASKHALLGWTKSLAREVPTSELRVHAVLPGGVDTEMVRSVRPDIDASALIAPDEIADLVVQLIGMRGNAMIDEISVRRGRKTAWE